MVPNPSIAQLLRDPVLLLAFGFGSGLARRGPGTWGSLLGLPLAAAWLHDLQGFALTLLVVTLVGIPICSHAARKMGVHDHSGIVWDEVAGQMLACLPLFWRPEAVNLVAGLGLAFVFFRLFDIAKPWPIKVIDRHVEGGLGIMLDDLLAGLAAAGCVFIALRLIG